MVKTKKATKKTVSFVYDKFIGVLDNNKNKTYIVVYDTMKNCPTREQALNTANKYFKCKKTDLVVTPAFVRGKHGEELVLSKEAGSRQRVMAVYRK